MKLHLDRWLIGIALLLGLTWYLVENSDPLLPGPIALTLTLPPGVAGQTSALVSTGQGGAGDLLYLRTLDATTFVVGYDSWAVGGPISAPITFTPGSPCPLVIELPSLAAPRRVDRKARGPLRVVYAGREVLRGEVHYFGRWAREVWFAHNAIGGTITTHAFPGQLTTAEGRLLVGRPAALYPWTARLRAWLFADPLLALVALVLPGVGAFLLPFLARRIVSYFWTPPPDPGFAGHPRPPHVAFLVTVALCTGVFLTIVTGFTFRLFEAESFGQFYDHQVASLLAGRLDVPEAALSSESFLFEGKYYGYFGPTPALLRLPCALAGVGFGRLSRSFLVLDYLACLGAVYALLIHAARRLSRRDTWPARADVVLLVGGAGLGSTLLFVSSRAYIYHEAILCGTAFALWGTWASLRWLAAPAQHRWWLLALACGVLAVHARPPAGLFALALLGSTAAALLVRGALDASRSSWRRAAPIPQAPEDAGSARGEGIPPSLGLLTQGSVICEGPAAVRATDDTAVVPPGMPRTTAPCLLTPLLVGALSILGVLSFNGLSYLKFKSFEGAPLKYHVQYSAERLANIEGRNFHLANVPYGFASYVWRPSFLLLPRFPYFFIDGHDPAAFPGCRNDLAENTLALPYAMPSLVFLAALGGVLALVRWPASRLPLAVLAAGAAPVAAALFAAVAISHRYTADFVPGLLGAAAFGLAGLPLLPPTLRRLLYPTTWVLFGLAILVTLAFTLHYQGEIVWGVPADVKAHYFSLRKTMDHLLGFSRP